MGGFARRVKVLPDRSACAIIPPAKQARASRGKVGEFMRVCGRAYLQVLLLLFPIAVSAQWQKKPYTEWSEKEALNVLNNSPWGQTQTVADTSKMFDTGRTLASGESRVAEVPQTNFRIRFFSAKPIRQAISRLVE